MLIVFLMITTYFSRFFIYLQGLLNVVVVFQVGQIYFLLSSYCNNNTVSLFSSSLPFFSFFTTLGVLESVVISFQIQCNNNNSVALATSYCMYRKKRKEEKRKKKKGRERERGGDR